MRMTTTAPSYPVGNAITLSGAARLGFYGNDFSGFEITQDFLVVDGAGNIDPNKSAVLRQVEANAPGTVAAAKSDSFDWNSLVGNISQLVGVAMQGKAQHDILQMNLTRAQQGLPPINAQAYMPGVNVGIAQDTKNLIYTVAAVGIGALILPGLLRGSGGNSRRRRRR